MTKNLNTTYNERIYERVGIAITKGVATITLDNPPANVLSGKLMKELRHLLSDLAHDNEVKVIVFDSSNTEFFIAHVDINILDEKETLDELAKSAPQGLNIFQAVGEMIRQQPQVTIVKLKGIARGGGAEFAAAADMCFASLEKGKLGQIEALMGIIPGGGATQYLSSKMPRGRVLEIILGANLFDAITAEKYGWINRALPHKDIDAFVDKLAIQIASLPEGVIETAKEAIPFERNLEGFRVENDGWAKLAFHPRTAAIMKAGMQNGAQTMEGELNAENLFRNAFK